jgi:hypothetical protein
MVDHRCQKLLFFHHVLLESVDKMIDGVRINHFPNFLHDSVLELSPFSPFLILKSGEGPFDFFIDLGGVALFLFLPLLRFRLQGRFLLP